MSLEVILRHRFEGFALDAAFSAPDGITALFGRSGAGKTTVVEAIAGLLRPDEGRVSAADTVLLDTSLGLSLPAHRRRVGYVFQEGRLFPHLTVRQNLAFGRWFAPRGAEVEDLEHIVEVLGVGPSARPSTGAALGRREAARRHRAGVPERAPNPVDGRAAGLPGSAAQGGDPALSPATPYGNADTDPLCQPFGVGDRPPRDHRGCDEPRTRRSRRTGGGGAVRPAGGALYRHRRGRGGVAGNDPGPRPGDRTHRALGERGAAPASPYRRGGRGRAQPPYPRRGRDHRDGRADRVERAQYPAGHGHRHPRRRRSGRGGGGYAPAPTGCSRASRGARCARSASHPASRATQSSIRPR